MALQLAALLFLALFFLGPIFGLFTQFQMAGFLETLRDPSFLKSLGITVASGLGGAFVSTTIGLYFARQFARHLWGGRRLQRLLLLMPYLIPNFILAIAFVISWNPTTGLLNFLFKFPGGLYGLFGMTLLLAIAHVPVAFLSFEDKIKRIDSSLTEAARLSGAESWQVFFKIELPLLRPALISALSLCFALNISAFAIPAWIGAPQKIYPLAYKVYQAIQLGGLEGLPDAANVSVVLFALSLIPILVGQRLLGQEGKYALLTGKVGKVSLEPQSFRSFLTFQTIFALSQFLFWLAPLCCLFLTTIVPPGCLQSSGMSCFKQASLTSYHYVVFELAETKAALYGSLIYGSLSSLIIIVAATGILALFVRQPRKLKVIEAVLALPLATPGAIIALGLIVVYSGRYGINLYNTPWIAVLAYIIKHLTLAFQPLRTGYTHISRSLLEAARLSGAKQRQVWSRIVLPILQPECLGGFFLVLIPVLGELTMSVFLASPKFKSIGTVLFDLQDYADQSSAGALAIGLVILILVLNELSRLFSKGRLGY